MIKRLFSVILSALVVNSFMPTHAMNAGIPQINNANVITSDDVKKFARVFESIKQSGKKTYCVTLPDETEQMDISAVLKIIECSMRAKNDNANFFVVYRNNYRSGIESFLNAFRDKIRVIIRGGSDNIGYQALELLANVRCRVNYNGKDYDDVRDIPITFNMFSANYFISPQLSKLLDSYRNAIIVYKPNTTLSMLNQLKKFDCNVIYNGAHYASTSEVLKILKDSPELAFGFDQIVTKDDICFLKENPTKKIVLPDGLNLSELASLVNVPNPVNYKGRDYNHVVNIFKDSDVIFDLRENPVVSPLDSTRPVITDEAIILLNYRTKNKVRYKGVVYNNIDEILGNPELSKDINIKITLRAGGSSIPMVTDKLFVLFAKSKCKFEFRKCVFDDFISLINEYKNNLVVLLPKGSVLNKKMFRFFKLFDLIPCVFDGDGRLSVLSYKVFPRHTKYKQSSSSF